jgi:alanyl-tRNA synthetase
VVSIGNKDEDLYSIELCGGTHSTSTSQIGLFKIISQSSIGSGVRRIEAICSLQAIHYLSNYMEQHKKLAKLLNVEESNLESKLQNTLDENKALKKDLEKINYKYNLSLLEKSLVKENNLYYLCQEAQSMTIPNLKDLCNVLFKKYDNLICLLFSVLDEKNNKASFVLSTNIANYEDNLKIRLTTILTNINGSGGGSKNFYQGSGDYSSLLSLKESFISTIKVN